MGCLGVFLRVLTEAFMVRIAGKVADRALDGKLSRTWQKFWNSLLQRR